MPFGPFYAALPVDGLGKHYVDQPAWDQMMGNFSNWPGAVNGGGNTLSNVVLNTALAITAATGTFSGLITGSAITTAGIATALKFSATGKSSLFGANGGSASACTLADANILLYSVSSTNWAGIGVDGAGTMFFRTGLSGTPNARMVILTDGTVGIGTVSPTFPLHIGGTGQATGSPTDAGGRGGSLFLDDSTGVGAGSGGALWLGFGGSRFACIKGFLDNGSGNTLGSISFSTRTSTSDTFLTEKARLYYDGKWQLQNITSGTPATPTGSGFLYAEAGALKWKGSSGTVTTIAAA